MKNSHFVEIDKWKKRNSLTRQSQVNPLLEAFRRINMFKKGDVNAKMVMLAFPSELRDAVDFFTPTNTETAKVQNWYDLTEKGKQVIKDLPLVWNEKEMNEHIFDLRMPRKTVYMTSIKVTL